MTMALLRTDESGNKQYMMPDGWPGTGCQVCGMVSHNWDSYAMRYTLSGRAICQACSEKVTSRQDGATGPRLPSNCPPGYANATFETLPPKSQRFLKEWPEKKPFVVIGGIPGSGKSFAVWALEKRMCLYGRRVLVLNCLAFRGRWLGELLNRDRVLESAINARWLVLDGLTDGAATDGWAQAVQRILDHRMQALAPTIVTTMDRPARIEEAWGAHILSRLNQFHWVMLPDKDLRSTSKVQIEKK